MFPPELEFLGRLLADEKLNELMFNGYRTLFAERGGHLEKIPSPFTHEKEFEHALNSLSLLHNVAQTGPYQLDGMLPDGSRFHLTRPPQSPDGPTLTIRKFVLAHRGMENLVAAGTCPPKVARFLASCVRARLNILVSGGTSSGKTTLLNALCAKAAMTERIITIEDVPEIQLNHPNWVRMVAVHGEKGASLRDCVTGSLRMRPDRLVVGECRSTEALEMLQAMNTGHDGSITTLHANSASDALTRLESLILFHASAEIPVKSLRRQIVDALDLIVHMKKNFDGRRQIEEIVELESMEGEIVTRLTLFKRHWGKGNGESELLCTGMVPGFIKYFEGDGIALPRNFFDPYSTGE